MSIIKLKKLIEEMLREKAHSYEFGHMYDMVQINGERKVLHVEVNEEGIYIPEQGLLKWGEIDKLRKKYYNDISSN